MMVTYVGEGGSAAGPQDENGGKRTLNPILVRAGASTMSRPSKTNAGFFMCLYTSAQSISLNSFHSVAITIASASLHASSADLQMVTCFLTARQISFSQRRK